MKRLLLFLFFLLSISGALAHNAEDHSSRTSQEILDAHGDTLIEYDLDDDDAINLGELREAVSDWQDEDIGSVALDAVDAAYTKGTDLSELDEEDSNSDRPIKKLDGNWASVGDEKEFRLGFFADRSNALVNPLDDGAIKVTYPENDQSIEVEPGEIGDASDIFGTSITDNIFANCGYVQKGNSKFAQAKINFYYGENGGGSTGAMERRIEDELASCESYRADITSKNVNFAERSQYTLYFRPGTSVDGTEEPYSLNTGSKSQEIVFADQVGGIGQIGIRPDIGDKFIPDWSTGEEIRIHEGIYAQLGEAKYDSEDERYFSTKLYKGSKKEEIVQRDLNWVGRVTQDRDRQPEQLVMNGENTYIWIDESGDLMRDDRTIVKDINDRCNQGAHPIETIDAATLVINVECYETGYEYGKRPSKIELWKVPSDKRNEAKLPQASLTIPSDNYEVGQDIGLELDIKEEGDYALELSGAGIDREKTISSSQEINIEPSREGKIKASLSVDSDDWLLKEDSDLVSEASANVAENLPGASISYDHSSAAGLFVGQKTTVKFDFKQPGNYKISSKLNGEELVSEEIEAEEGETYTKEIRLTKSGNINSKVVAPGGFWVFGSDKVVASDTANVEQLPSDTIRPEVGETVNISISEDEVVQFRDTYFKAEETYRTRSTYQRDPNARDGVDVDVLRNSVDYSYPPLEEFNLGDQNNGFNVMLCSFEKITEGDYAKFAFGELGSSTEELRSVCESDSTTGEDSSSEDLRVEISCNSDSVSPGDAVSCFVDEFPDVQLGEFEWSTEDPVSITDRTSETITVEVPEDTDSEQFTVVYNLQASGTSISDSFQVETLVEPENSDSSSDSEAPDRVGDASNYPRDPDDDGLYEDVNGDEELTVSDSELLFYNTESAPVEYFDFNEDGAMNVADAQALYNFVSDEPRENTITVQTDNVQTGAEVSIQTETKLNLADKGYQIVVENPEGETILDETSQEITQINTFRPEETGEYTASIYPTGRIQSIVRSLTGPLKSKEFTASSNQLEWINYCRNNDYNTESIQEKASCIEDEIIPEYFEESTGSSPGVAESLCQDLLGYGYNTNERSCVA